MTVCRFNGSTQPRTLPGRHREECPNRGATGAQSDEHPLETPEAHRDTERLREGIL